jgi:hypothetical protein
MDEADAGNAIAEVLLGARLAVRKPNGPEATGECFECGEELAGGKRWCDSDCRDAWEKRRGNL